MVHQILFSDFNPHSRKGSDGEADDDKRRPVISIHTPARGVTKDREALAAWLNDFNPHSRKGSDRLHIIPIHVHSEFQSTLPQGE